MRHSRKLFLETLEERRLLAADCPRHNLAMPADVNGDGTVAPLDALLVISHLNLGGQNEACAAAMEGESVSLVDVNDDGWLSPLDALLVINALNPPEAAPAPSSASLGNYPSYLSQLEQLGPDSLLTAEEVKTLLNRASQASASTDAIIAVVDRTGRILGVRVEAGVSTTLTNDANKLAFAIDGAVSKARTAALFSNNATPLTSRTIRFISQSTVTQREVQSSPQNSDPRYQGPGLVGPIGVGAHFPPAVNYTSPVDLFYIEHQSRDSQLLNGLDGQRGTGDDLALVNRFNVDSTYVAAGAEAFLKTWPESYGYVSGSAPNAQARGLATLPGGVPLFKVIHVDDKPRINLVGGIGVFFPGEDGFATYEQNFQHASENGGVVQSEAQRTNAPRVLESEFIAVIAAAGNGFIGPFARNVSAFNAQLDELKNFVLPTGRIDLVGITLEIYGPNPTTANPIPGIDTLIRVGNTLGPLGISSGIDYAIDEFGAQYLPGQPVPEGWLVAPHDSSDGQMTASQVDQMIAQGIAQAEWTRAAIRLTEDFKPGPRTRMVLAVADKNGEVLGLYRMPDATVFSVDVAVAKARNTGYYADPTALQPADRVDFNADGTFGAVSTTLSGGDTLPLGTALTNRTFRYLAAPRYPTGINLPATADDGLVNDPSQFLTDQRPDIAQLVGPQSILQLPGLNPLTAENIDNLNPLSASVYASATSPSPMAFGSFNPSRNFRDPGDSSIKIAGTGTPYPLANQNGLVLFPGSSPIYVLSTILAGGLGVSGDGVDQDDVVTAYGQVGFGAPVNKRADQYAIGGVRLPYQKYNRNPGGA